MLLSLRRVSQVSQACLLTLLAGHASADVTPNAAMLRYPDISADSIVFLYANDLWICPRDGGMASPLASPPGLEVHPKFSPDGKTIAFVGNYDGGRDIYTIPVTGGVPSRVTHHPGGETICDWTPDGKGITFHFSGLAGLGRQMQLFKVSAAGGLPEQLPVPYGTYGTLSPDGNWLAYTPHSTDNRTWKRYRGGMATDIWLFNVQSNQSKRATDWEGTDTQAMWVPGGDGKTVYYISDAGPEHRLNVWSYTVETGARAQVTNYTSDDVRWPSMGPGKGGKGEIIFQLGSELRAVDLDSKKDRVITVTIPGDRPKVRARSVDASRTVTGGAISPSGKRVLIEARGDIWSAPAKEGVIRNLTRTDGVFERDSSWSPDGKWVAYLSDESGEYELWVRPSDARAAEEEKKEEAKAGEAKKEEAKPAEPVAKEPPAKPRKLTNLGAGFRYNPTWSPDSKLIALTDAGGRVYLVTVETGETKLIDTDPWSNQTGTSFSHDSQWIAYVRADEANSNGCIWLYNTKTGAKTRVTNPMFPVGGAVFDRKGDWLFFSASRNISSPTYSDLDTTFVYTGSAELFMAPLRKDVKNPWLPKADEEELKKDEKADKKDEKKDEKKPDAAPDDGVSGTWQATATADGAGLPPGGIAFTLNLKVGADGSVSGSVVSAMGSGKISQGTYDRSSGALSITITVGQAAVTMNGTVKNGEVSGTWTAPDGTNGKFSGRRTSGSAGGDDKAAGADKEKAKEVKIDLEGLEGRALKLPVGPGNFGGLAATEDGKFIYARTGARGSGEPPAIKIFDPKDDAPEEKTVVAGAAGFTISADGKKLLVFRGGANLSVVDASAGGKSTSVPTAGMNVTVDPRTEWKQILTDVYRLQRDFFYEPTLHGVNWAGFRDHYMKMIDDCASREDVAYVIAEFISELNIGHAYVTAPGDVEDQPQVGVGMLGCDYKLVSGADGTAYQITRVFDAGDWDTDARGPLSQHGVKAGVGDYLLAVNGVPVDTAKDPWAAFVATANRPTTITVSSKPKLDGAERDVVVKPIADESYLRFRTWIQDKREYVEKKSGGQIGYIYVPNTGVDGQNELFRQFVGERGKAALLVDERWNGGGQIPTRFIELLNRPVTNYWARRDGKDWVWPPDSHQGPKAMLINGLAGSGGDMFPWLFKRNQIGKVFGTRTWGGLVGISGNPGLIDGGGISVPTFGFYETDGTWGVEGHGVDPDVEIIDDPAKMVAGVDPQIDAAVDHLLNEIKTHGYTPPKRPASPDRSGMGIKPEDK